jgi:hypothetical protein
LVKRIGLSLTSTTSRNSNSTMLNLHPSNFSTETTQRLNSQVVLL